MAMRSLILKFVLQLVLDAGFVAIGLLIAFWPATYLRWVRWSKVESYARWVVRGLDFENQRYGWRIRMIGVWLALFGVIAATLTIWIYWFQ